jgi:uncharacterized protein (UPF0548 family)
VADWRLGRRWRREELRERLAALPELDRNFQEDGPPGEPPPDWRRYASRSRIATASEGPPDGEDGPFARARKALTSYAFSDPSIVEGHFDPDAPLDGRHMLLELKVLMLRYVCGCRVEKVQDRRSAGSTGFGFRYDTLEGHVERGFEWFRVEQDHGTGDVTFHVEAWWLPGDFPNWWSRVGFALVGRWYQRRWHRRAHRRMAAFARGRSLYRPFSRRELAHQGPDVIFTRGPAPEIHEVEVE